MRPKLGSCDLSTIPVSIADRITQPTPEEVRLAREKAGLTQDQAAAVVSAGGKARYRTWAAYEAQTDNPDSRRAIPLPAWELFLLITGQHPGLEVVPKKRKRATSTGNSEVYE